MAIVSTNRFVIVKNSGKEQTYSNLFTQHHHLGIFGSTRSGKSTLLKEIVALALDEGLPVTGLEDSHPLTQISPLVELAQIKGAFLNVKNVAFNLFELPDLRHFSEIAQEARLGEYKDLLAFALKTIVLDTPNEISLFAATIRCALKCALEAFFADPEIYQRYQVAIQEGPASKAWLTMPTLIDFLPYCTPQYLSLSEQDAHVCQAIQNSLINCLSHPLGKAISTNSPIPVGIQFMLLGFQNKHMQNTPVLTISVLLCVMRRLLSAPKSLLFSDECYWLINNPQTAMFIARVCAMGKKFGIQFAFTAQNIDGIAPQILHNTDLKLIGKIPPTDIRTFEKTFEHPHEIISQCATSDFNPTQSYTNWLLDGVHRLEIEIESKPTSNLEGFTFCRHYSR